MKRALTITLTALLIFAAFVTAQPADESPEQIVEQAFVCAKDLDFFCLSRLFEPSDLAAFRDIFLPSTQSMWGPRDSNTVLNPDFPADLADALDRIDSLPPDSFFAVSMSYHIQLNPMFIEPFTKFMGEVVGRIEEADTLVYVVTRSSMPFMGVEIENVMSVHTLRRTADGWRFAMPAEFRMIAEGMRMHMGQ